MNKQKQRINGITLIALVITIIVLLILSGVTIVTLIGENGILTKASDSKEKTTKAGAYEKVEMAVAGSIVEDGELDYDELKKNLNKVEGIDKSTVPEEITKESFPFTVTVDRTKVTIQDNGGVERQEGEEFNADELTIGELSAKNTDKYGWKVKNYNVQYNYGTNLSSTSNVWRLFYQDTKYTYLITDELVGKYIPKEYYGNPKYNDKYSDGTKMSIEGQKLNGRVNSLFTGEDTKANANIRATVWFTDTTKDSEWSKYKNGDAVFAIASPTAELFEASYNKNTSSNHSTYKKGDISVTLGTYGYKDNTNSNWLKSEDSHGIYNKDNLPFWWLASPGNTYNNGCLLAMRDYRRVS